MFAVSSASRALAPSLISSALVAAACCAYSLAVQYFSGSWSASFRAYPDEPSHFVGAVMVRDWLMSGRWLAPLEFSRTYYDHYPFFAVGYWPPLFSVVTGLCMLITGVGRQQALMIPALFAAATGFLVFHFACRHVGILLGVCASSLYLSLPAVQRWICAVMVDHMTAFLCLATAACLIRYLKRPFFWNGVLCAVCCSCAILSKYSAVYVVALPPLAVLLFRRVELLKNPSFLVQPLIVGLMVGPWAVWTRKLAFYGLPSEPEALTAKRAATFVLETFKIFPPALLVVIVLGLIALAVRPKAWREDLVVLSLLCLLHLAFLILSPVGVEQRYLLVPAAVLLIISFAGWSALLELTLSGRRWEYVFPILVAILTTLFVVLQFNHFVPVPKDDIRRVVALILKDPSRKAQRIVVPSVLDGPFIAEFISQSRIRPYDYLLRPNKILAHSDWFGHNYSSTFASPEEMMDYFQQNPVDLIIWNEGPKSVLRAHELIMSEMLQHYPLAWQEVLSLDSTDGLESSWRIYKFNIANQKSR